MMRVSTAIAKYNYPLIAYHIGEIAAELGDKIAPTFEDNPIRARTWTGLLLFQLYPSIWGNPPSRGNRGWLGTPGPTSQPRRRAATSSSRWPTVSRRSPRPSADLVNGTKGQIPAHLKTLSERVADLRAVLAKNPPSDKRLVPGGPALPIRRPGRRRRRSAAR